jgi:hypothetical protein
MTQTVQKGRENVKDGKRSGRPISQKADEDVEKVLHVVHSKHTFKS